MLHATRLVLSNIGTDPYNDVLLAIGLFISGIQLRNGRRINDTKAKVEDGVAKVEETKQLAETAASNALTAKKTAATVAGRVEDVHSLVNSQLEKAQGRQADAEDQNAVLTEALRQAQRANGGTVPPAQQTPGT